MCVNFLNRNMLLTIIYNDIFCKYLWLISAYSYIINKPDKTRLKLFLGSLYGEKEVVIAPFKQQTADCKMKIIFLRKLKTRQKVDYKIKHFLLLYDLHRQKRATTRKTNYSLIYKHKSDWLKKYITPRSFQTRASFKGHR